MTQTAHNLDRISMHGLSVELSPIAGTTVHVVQGKKDVYDGFRCRVPAISQEDIATAMLERADFGAVILRFVEGEQRALLRQHERNGRFGLNQSLDVAAVALPALVDFMVSAGASAVRITKELIAALTPTFRMAVAARWAEVKGVADTLGADECLAASRSTQEKYLLVLDAIRADGFIDPKDSDAVRRIVSMAQALPMVAENEILRNGFDAVLAKLSALDRKRVGLMGDDVEEL